MKKEAVAAGSGSMKQGAAPQGTVGENKSVVGSKKGPAAPSKSLAPQTRRWVWLLVCLGIIAILVITALIIGLVFLTKSSGSHETPTTTTVAPTTAPVVCRDGKGGEVKDVCIIPSSSCDQQCSFYKYEWPLKNVSIMTGSFIGATHVCQKGSVRGRCNTEGNCETGGTNSNLQDNPSNGSDWLDTCDQLNPCWDNASVKTIHNWTGMGVVVNLNECTNETTAKRYCQPNAAVVLGIQHRQCKSGKRCDGVERPFRVWSCALCGTLRSIPSCQGQPNGVKCKKDHYCLGGECEMADDFSQVEYQKECGKMNP